MLSLRRYVIIFSFLSCIGLAAWAIFVFTVNPYEAGFGLFTLFYIDLAVAFVGISTLVGYGLRAAFRRRRTSHQRAVTFRTSFRQGVLFALFFVGLLLMQASRLLSLGNGILLLIALTLVEFFFQSKEPVFVGQMTPAESVQKRFEPDAVAADESDTVEEETVIIPAAELPMTQESVMSTAWPDMSITAAPGAELDDNLDQKNG